MGLSKNRTFKWVKKVILSSETASQLVTANNLIRNYYKIFTDSRLDDILISYSNKQLIKIENGTPK